MSKNKTIISSGISSLVDNAATKAVKKIMEESTNRDNFYFAQFKKHQNKQLFPQNLTTITAAREFNQRIKPQKKSDSFSSELDWLSPHSYEKYILLEQKPIEYKIKLVDSSDENLEDMDPDTLYPDTLYCKHNGPNVDFIMRHSKNGGYSPVVHGSIGIEGNFPLGKRDSITQDKLTEWLPIILKNTAANGITRGHTRDGNLYLGLELGNDQLTYHISTPTGDVHTDTITLKGCDLKKSPLTAEKITTGKVGSRYDKIKAILGDQDAVIMSDDGVFFYVDRQAKTVDKMPVSPKNQAEANVLMAAFHDGETTNWLIRQSIAALTITDDLPMGRTFPIDDIRDSLTNRTPKGTCTQNIYDPRLSSVFEVIAEHEGCDLIKSERNTADITNHYDQIKYKLRYQDAVIQSEDGGLFYADCKAKTVRPIAVMPGYKAQSDALLKAFTEGEFVDDRRTATRLERQLISTLTNRTFAYDPQNFMGPNTPDDHDFFDMLDNVKSERGGSIQPYLSQSEILRYHLAFLAVMDAVPTDHDRHIMQNAFAREMKTQIFKDVCDDLNAKLQEMDKTGPKETVLLVKKLMKQIKSTSSISHGQKIKELRELQDFLNSSWGNGTAITEYAEVRDLSPLQASVHPYANKQVIKPKALPIDATRMVNYDQYKHIFDRYPAEMANYNFKIELNRTRDALQTKFYAPVTFKQFQEIKLNRKNCFIFYENKLHHINSDGTCRSIPIKFDLVKPVKKNVNDRDVIVNEKLDDQSNASLGKEFRIRGLDRDVKLGIIPVGKMHGDFTFQQKLPDEISDFATTLYGREYHYSEIQMKQILGDMFPEDPNLKLAHEMMNRAVQGTTVKEYLQSVRSQAPKSGKLMSAGMKALKNSSDSIGKFWVASEKAASTRRSLQADITSFFYGPTEERIEALRTVRRMGQSELTLNEQTIKKNCELVSWSDSPAETIEGVLIPKNIPSLQGRGKNKYILVEKQGKAPELYFVDRSADQPVITQLFEGNQGFFSHLSGLLKNYALGKPDNYYQQLPGCSARIMRQSQQTPYTLTKDDLQKIKELKEVLIVYDAATQTFKMYFYRNDKCEHHEFKKDNSTPALWGILNGNISQSSNPIILPEHIAAINKELTTLDSSTQILVREKRIPQITPELARFITAGITHWGFLKATAHVGLKPTVYDQHLDNYKLNEASNQLTSILVRRKALWEAYEEALQKPIYAELQTKCTILRDNKKPTFSLTDLNETFVAFDKTNNRYTKYWFDPADGTIQSKTFTKDELWTNLELPVSEVLPPNLEELHRTLEAERYRSVYIDPNSYDRLNYWNDHQDVPPPFPLEKGVLYYALDRKTDKFTCFAISPQGELAFTPANIPPTQLYEGRSFLHNDDIVMNLLPLAMEHGLVLKPALVHPRFLDRCEEAQRYLQEIGDQSYDHGSLPASIITMEKRKSMLDMMQWCATDPTSLEAKHCLRDSHKLYFTRGAPDLNDPKFNDSDSYSFFLDIDSSEMPVLYRFVFDEKAKQYIPTEVTLSHSKFTTASEKKLLQLGNAAMQLKRDRNAEHGDSIDLSCHDVHKYITARQVVSEGVEPFKMHTAQEMIEEIIAEELSWENVAQNVIMGLFTIGLGILFIPGIMTIPAAAPVWIHLMFTGGGMVTLGIKLAFMGLLTYSCFQSAIVSNTWFQPELPMLQEKLSALKSLQIETEANHLLNVPNNVLAGLSGEVVRSRVDIGEDEDDEEDDDDSLTY